MSFILDTDICSAHLKGVESVTNRFLQYTGQLYVSTVSLAELYSWALRSKSSPRRSQGLIALLSDVTVLDVDQDVACKFGEVRARLFDQGQPASSMDLLIAATALVHGLTVVTHNTRHFANVPELPVVDWVVPLAKS